MSEESKASNIFYIEIKCGDKVKLYINETSPDGQLLVHCEDETMTVSDDNWGCLYLNDGLHIRDYVVVVSEEDYNKSYYRGLYREYATNSIFYLWWTPKQLRAP